MPVDYKDLYAKYEGHPRFQSTRIVEDDIIEIIVQKLEITLFSNKGSLFGEPNMGCDVEYYLWQTKLPTNELKEIIREQIDTYIPELNTIGYQFDVLLYEGDYRDIMYLNFIIKGYNFEMLIQ